MLRSLLYSFGLSYLMRKFMGGSRRGYGSSRGMRPFGRRW